MLACKDARNTMLSGALGAALGVVAGAVLQRVERRRRIGLLVLVLAMLVAAAVLAVLGGQHPPLPAADPYHLTFPLGLAAGALLVGRFSRR